MNDFHARCAFSFRRMFATVCVVAAPFAAVGCTNDASSDDDSDDALVFGGSVTSPLDQGTYDERTTRHTIYIGRSGTGQELDFAGRYAGCAVIPIDVTFDGTAKAVATGDRCAANLQLAPVEDGIRARGNVTLIESYAPMTFHDVAIDAVLKRRPKDALLGIYRASPDVLEVMESDEERIRLRLSLGKAMPIEGEAVHAARDGAFKTVLSSVFGWTSADLFDLALSPTCRGWVAPHRDELGGFSVLMVGFRDPSCPVALIEGRHFRR